jgi:hypothetical protein
VANNWADLTDGSLRAVINRTETGAEVPFDPTRHVWTNTATTGAIFGGQDCENWTTNSNSAEGGMAGIASATNVQWTSALGFDCDFNYRLYCFQQS